MKRKELDKMVIVCNRCLRASCWQGAFYCEDSRNAGTVEKSVRELRELKRESADYWEE